MYTLFCNKNKLTVFTQNVFFINAFIKCSYEQ